MENEDSGAPVAAALTQLVMLQIGQSTADRKLLDALLIAVCRNLPSMSAEVESVFNSITASPTDLEGDSLDAYTARIQEHQRNVAVLVRLASTA